MHFFWKRKVIKKQFHLYQDVLTTYKYQKLIISIKSKNYVNSLNAKVAII